MASKGFVQAEESYSFLQLKVATRMRMRTSSDLANEEVVNLMKKLAREQHSFALSQLASRIQTMYRYASRTGEDPFAKIKTLINEMIAKLIKEAQAEASEKAYCDEEMGKTKAKKEELTGDIEKLTAKIDKATTSSVELKEDVKELQKELADLQESQAEMDKIREEENTAYVTAKEELAKGLDAIRSALEVLRDYYGSKEESLLQDNNKFTAFMQHSQQQPAAPQKHEKSAGAGGSIISMLEVAESDFAKNLAEIETEEAAAQEEYDKVTQENKVTKSTKEQDVKYKTKEFTALDKEVAELSADRDGSQTELDAVLMYFEKIKDRCVAKPDPYEERKKRREAEIAGLKEALSILEGQAFFLQRRSIRAH
jgi:chromosome segregation ATPase